MSTGLAAAPADEDLEGFDHIGAGAFLAAANIDATINKITVKGID